MATDDKSEILTLGELKVTGRLVDASNATLYAVCYFENQEISCIYKPIAGERPLWDFSDGCLAHRERAAYLVSRALGLNIVPLTILREGPYGPGMVQEWITRDESIDLASFFASDNPKLREMALFDAIVNNTDRKIGHILPISEEEVYGCDHGVTFHVDDKLRTVLWQWANDRFTQREIDILKTARTLLTGQLAKELEPLLTDTEITSTLNRVNRLLENGCFPMPNPDWPAIPWPAF